MRKRGKQPKVRYMPSSGIQLALNGIQVIPNDKLNRIELMHLSSLTEFVEGRGNEHHWGVLINLANMAGEFGAQGVGPEVLEWVEKAQEGLVKASNSYVLDHDTIEALRQIISYQHVQMRSIPRCEFERILKIVGNKARTGAIDIAKRTPEAFG